MSGLIPIHSVIPEGCDPGGRQAARRAPDLKSGSADAEFRSRVLEVNYICAVSELVAAGDAFLDIMMFPQHPESVLSLRSTVMENLIGLSAEERCCRSRTVSLMM